MTALDVEWSEAVDALGKLHAQRFAAYAVRRLVVGGEQPGVDTIGLRMVQVNGLEFQSGQHGKRGWVQVGDVIALFAELGLPEPEKEPDVHPAPTRARGDARLRDRADVENEIAERQAFTRHAATPEGQAERAEARRQRKEQRDAEGEAAMAATLES